GDYLIHSERYGIPQSRHRVILVGVRKEQGVPEHPSLEPGARPVTVSQTIDDLPRIRSRLSREESREAWRKAVQAAPAYVKGWRAENESTMMEWMRTFVAAATNSSTGGAFIPKEYRRPKKLTELQQWLH